MARRSTSGQSQSGGRAQRRREQRAAEKQRRQSGQDGAVNLAEIPAPSMRMPAMIMPLILVIVGIAVYSNAIAAPFIFDDKIHVVQRADQIDSLNPAEVLSNTFRPVVQYSLAINFAMGGLEPAGYHVANILIHILAGLTLFGVVRRTAMHVVSDARSGLASWLAFSVALLWMVHPLQTQSVTYIIQRGESLASLFYLLTLYCSIRSVVDDRRRAWWWAGAIASCGLGMGSKAIVMSAPIAVVLWDVVFVTRAPLRETLLKRLPLYGGLAASWLIMILTGLFQGVMRTGGENAGIGFSVKTVTPVEYLFSQPAVLLHYLYLSFWPHTLVLDYDWQPVQSLAEGVLPGAVIVALLALTVWGIVKRHWMGFAGAVFFLVLAPTSSFVPLKDLAFEHRMYLPLASVIAVMAGLVWWGLNRFAPQASRMVALVLVMVIAGALAGRTLTRNGDYHNPLRLWEAAVESNPDNNRARVNLGNALKDHADQLASQGDSPGAQMAYAEAIRQLRAAYENYEQDDSGRALIALNLGAAFVNSGRYAQGLEVLEPVVQNHPDFEMAWFNLGLCYMNLNRPSAAADAFAQAVRLNPSLTQAGLNYGNMLVQLNRVEESIAAFETAIQHAPSTMSRRVLAVLHFNLGNSFFRLTRWDEAIEQYLRAQEIDPTYDRIAPAIDLARRQQAGGGA